MKTDKPDLGLLVFELTQACNQSCRFCYNFWRDGETPILPPSPAMAKKTLKKVLSQVNISTISFSGGEPMLLSNIHDLILYSRRHGSNINVLTNGTLLTPDDIGIFSDLGVAHLQIPVLCSDSHIHDYLTQVQGSWEKAINAVREAKTLSKTLDVNVVFILTALNKDKIRETFDLYRSLGVKTVLINRFNLGGQGLQFRRELELSHKEMRQAFKTMDDCAEGLELFSGVCTPVCILDPQQYRHIQFSFCNTDLKSRPITVNPLGDVRFCNHSPVVLGNIFQKDIFEILLGADTVARYSTIPEKCSNCSSFRFCRGGCRAASEQVYGTFDLPDPILG